VANCLSLRSVRRSGGQQGTWSAAEKSAWPAGSMMSADLGASGVWLFNDNYDLTVRSRTSTSIPYRPVRRFYEQAQARFLDGTDR